MRSFGRTVREHTTRLRGVKTCRGVSDAAHPHRTTLNFFPSPSLFNLSPRFFVLGHVGATSITIIAFSENKSEVNSHSCKTLVPILRVIYADHQSSPQAPYSNNLPGNKQHLATNNGVKPCQSLALAIHCPVAHTPSARPTRNVLLPRNTRLARTCRHHSKMQRDVLVADLVDIEHVFSITAYL